MANVVFNSITRIIQVTKAPELIDGEQVIKLDVQKDFYSQGKHDWIADENLRKLNFPVRAVGGDDLPGTKQLGDTYFLASDWKVAPYEGNHRFLVNGNFYSEDGTSPFNATLGNYNVFFELTVSSLVDSSIQQLPEIEYASFNGGVTIDVINGTPGTVFPAGTPAQPVNNLVDLHAISAVRKFNKIYVIGNLTLDASSSWIGHEFVGESALKTKITILPIADTKNCEYYECTVRGTLDDTSQIQNSVITGLDFVDGFIFQCAIGPEPIALGTSTIANLFSCYSTVPGSYTPSINMNGTGILGLRDYKGGMLLTNYHGIDSHTIGLQEGKLILDSNTITSGTFVVYGTGSLIDEEGNRIPSGVWNGGVTIKNELVDFQVLNFILSILKNRQEIDPLSNELVIYNDEGTQVLYRFDLQDAAGAPSSTEIFKRLPKPAAKNTFGPTFDKTFN